MSDKKDNKHLTSKHYSDFKAFSTNHSVTFMLKDNFTKELFYYLKRTKKTIKQDRIDRVMGTLIETAFENEDVMREVENKLKQ